MLTTAMIERHVRGARRSRGKACLDRTPSHEKVEAWHAELYHVDTLTGNTTSRRSFATTKPGISLITESRSGLSDYQLDLSHLERLTAQYMVLNFTGGDAAGSDSTASSNSA